MKNSPLITDLIKVSFGTKIVLHQISLIIPKGKITAIIGPNGSGKSTLLHTLARLIKPQSGTVVLDGSLINQLSTRDVAKKLAILPQIQHEISDITVEELVEQGRFPHIGPLWMLRKQDHNAIEQALLLTNMKPYAKRQLDSLSGGEKQRAWIALTLAQATQILLLDEPTTFLDVSHQLEILFLLKKLQQEKNMTIVLVLHDINQAIRFSDFLIVLDKGCIVTQGKPKTVLTKQMLARIFQIHAHIVTDPITKLPLCIPYAHTKNK